MAKGRKNHGNMRSGHSRQFGNSSGSLSAKRSRSGSGSSMAPDAVRRTNGKDMGNGSKRSINKTPGVKPPQ